MTSGGMSPSHTHTQSHSLHSSSAEGSGGRAWPTLGAMSAEAATVVRSTASTDSDAGSDQSDSETHRSNGAATDSPNEADIATHDAAVTIATHTDAPHHPGQSRQQNQRRMSNRMQSRAQAYWIDSLLCV